jgi:hypothetical protein
MTRKYVTCPKCAEATRVSTFSLDRVVLERDQGADVTVICSSWGATFVVHVNEVVARTNHLATYLVTAFGVFTWLVIILSGLYLNSWILLAATGLIGLPAAVRQAAEKMARTFNAYKI